MPEPEIPSHQGPGAQSVDPDLDIVSAKLLWVFEHLGEGPVVDLVLSRGGMSWFGGFAGGVPAGAIRFAIEFLRVNERVVGPFSVAHLASMAVIALGVALVLRWGRPLSTKHTFV